MVTGHAPPDFFIRRYLIASAHWQDHKGRSLPPGVFQDILPLLTPEDWHTLYQPGTFITSPPNGAKAKEEERTAKTSFHLAWYLDREMSLVTDLIGLLSIHKLPPLAIAQEAKQISKFFGKEKPHVLLRKFLLETDALGDAKWVKPLREDVRSELLDVLRTSRLERHTANGAGRRIFDLLLDHHQRIVECAKTWQPNLRDHAETLKGMSRT